MEKREKDFEEMWDEIEKKISEVSEMVDSLRKNAEDFEREVSEEAHQERIKKQQFIERCEKLLEEVALALTSEEFEGLDITKLTFERKYNEDGTSTIAGEFINDDVTRIITSEWHVDEDGDIDNEEYDEYDCDCGCNCDACECDEEDIARKEEFVDFLHNIADMIEASLYDNDEEDNDNGKTRKGKHSK